MFLTKVCRVFEKYQVPYVVVGGLAVNLHGFHRGTMDIDFIIEWTQKSLVQCEKALNEIGLISRHPIDAVNLFKLKNKFIKEKNMIAWNFFNPTDPSENVDIIITHSTKGKKVILKRVQGQNIIVLSKEDLIKMKQESGRSQDLIDIEALEDL